MQPATKQSYQNHINAALLPRGLAEAVHKLVDSAAWTIYSRRSSKKIISRTDTIRNRICYNIIVVKKNYKNKYNAAK